MERGRTGRSQSAARRARPRLEFCIQSMRAACQQRWLSLYVPDPLASASAQQHTPSATTSASRVLRPC
ncbi:unnamed protein product [Urochloa humidicola]